MSFGQLGRMLGITSDPKFQEYVDNLKNVTREDLEKAFTGKILWLCKAQALIIDSTLAAQVSALTTAGAGLGSIAIIMTRPLIDQYPLMNLLTFIPSVVGTVIILKNYVHTDDYLDRIEKKIIEPMKTENPSTI